MRLSQVMQSSRAMLKRCSSGVSPNWSKARGVAPGAADFQFAERVFEQAAVVAVARRVR